MNEAAAVSDPERDTIVAIATPPGAGALAIVRLSGAGALAMADAVFRGRAMLRDAATHTAHYGDIVRGASGAPGGGEVVDDVVATVFRSPASYTGEDTVEIACHGSGLVAATIVEVLLREGARGATPGEFTRRAFLNGKLDLTQAEAVAEVIGSATAAALRGARNRLNGAVGARVADLRRQLLDCAAHVELALDFAEEDVELAPGAQIAAEVHAVRAAIADMLATFRAGRMLRDGVHVVLAGPPNVGKSSLLNRLAQEARALVTDIPGTTRDVIREDLDIHGVPVRLHDTAGVRATAETVERLGVERTLATAQDADLVLFVSAANEPFPHDALRQVRAATGAPVVVIANKSDLLDRRDLGDSVAAANVERPALAVSARTGAHIDDLCNLLLERTVGTGGYTERTALVASARHRDSLQRAETALARAEQAAAAAQVGGELVAADLREAVFHLEEIVGIVASDDVLNRIFAEFCIGK
ncbi:MAG: tRNA uridine-5-carboxymethylaminomethyl(34) synthesis GTPase MnmE [Spirochaetaceae bacterium]|nr:tRNA uridine-5-carboxymethylaminomethyl(34) synthesis GTPase MnmE [Spirochaetaceae bacterium]